MALVCGVGVNDADYNVRQRKDGKSYLCAAYSAWHGILHRAYSIKCHKRQPTYSDVTVCDEWKYFTAFRAWWLEHHIDGWQIDKDLLSDGKIYSPQSCLYVPSWLNKFTTFREKCRGDWPIGVHYHKRDEHFRAQCCNPISGKKEVIGYFDNPIDAHQAWKARKLEIAFELKEKMDSIDLRIYPRVLEIINNAK